MQTARKVLCTPFPRFVGNPKQWLAHDGGSFDSFLSHNEGEFNCYSRISWLGRSGQDVLDRVFLDLDGEAPDAMTETGLVSNLRSDREFAQSVLGEVVEDARAVAELAFEESIPMIGVYTGKGIHLHLLYESRTEPQEQLLSNQQWVVDHCDVATYDPQVNGDTRRLCRVPNCRRFDPQANCATELWTVPFSRTELRQLTVDMLVTESQSPRDIPEPAESRPPFLRRRGYGHNASVEQAEVDQQPVGDWAEQELDEQMEQLIRSLVRMPCLHDRMMTSNPSHTVRTQAAVFLFNAGLGVTDVKEMYRRLGWHDFDPEVTEYQLKRIRKRRIESVSCQTMIDKGLCVFQSDNRSECAEHNYPGGEQHW